MAKPRIVVLDDWERAMRRLGDWQTIDAQAGMNQYKYGVIGMLIGVI